MDSLKSYLNDKTTISGTKVTYEIPEEPSDSLRGKYFEYALQGFQSLPLVSSEHPLTTIHMNGQASQHVLALDSYCMMLQKYRWRILAPIPLDVYDPSVMLNDDVLYCHNEDRWCNAPWWISREGMNSTRQWVTGGETDGIKLAARLPQIVTIIGDGKEMIAFLTIAPLLRMGGNLIVTGSIDPALWSLCLQCFKNVTVGSQLLVATGFIPLGKLIKKLVDRYWNGGCVLSQEWIVRHTPECLKGPSAIFPEPLVNRGWLQDVKDPPISAEEEARSHEPRRSPSHPSASSTFPTKRRRIESGWFHLGDDGHKRLRVTLANAKGAQSPPYTGNGPFKCTPFTSNWNSIPEEPVDHPSTNSNDHRLLETAAFIETLKNNTEDVPQNLYAHGLLKEDVAAAWEKSSLFTLCHDPNSAELAFVHSHGDLLPQVVSALKALKKGGHLILRFPWKIRSIFEAGVFILLSACFEKVRLYQPQASAVQFFVGIKCNDKPALAQLEAVALQVPQDHNRPYNSNCVTARILSPFSDLRRYLIQNEWRSSEQICNVMQYLTTNGLKKWIFPNAKKKKVWLATGSFDPIHENHIRIALWVLQNKKADCIYFVANTETNPYKRTTDIITRSEMIQRRIQLLEQDGTITKDQIQVSQFRMPDSNWPAREKLVQMMEQELYQDEICNVEVGFLVGQDSFIKSYQSGTKHKNTGLFNLKKRPMPVIVFPRSGYEEVYIPENFIHCIESAKGYTEEPVSSTSVRHTIASGNIPSITHLHPIVYDYIEKNELYKEALPTEIQTFYDAQADENDDGLRMDACALTFRNCNNFGKAVTIERTFSLVRNSMGIPYDAPLAVLDLGCGKGGDIRKFQNGNVKLYVGIDTALKPLQTAVKRAQEARNDATRAKHGELKGEQSMSMIFTQGDYTSPITLPQKIINQRFHVVSAQMTIHYAFTTESNVRTLLKNVSDRLVPNGIFFGTLPNADHIVTRVSSTSPHQLIENHVTIDFSEVEYAKLSRWPQEHCYNLLYSYNLPGAVNLPEPLAHFPTFSKLAQEYNLKLIFGPASLSTVVKEALEEGGGDVGRLKRIYFYKGGLDTNINADFLNLYSVFGFQKENSNDSSGAQLSENIKDLPADILLL